MALALYDKISSLRFQFYVLWSSSFFLSHFKINESQGLVQTPSEH